MSLDVVIVRHGETDYNLTNTIQGQTDIPLNENGIKQAQLVAERLKGEHFTAVYSSDLSRAMVTAKTIAPGLEIIPDRRLREWLLGDWQGKTVAEIEKMSPGGFRAAINDPDSKVPNGESSNDILMRINTFITDLVKTHTEGKILLVSHGGAIRKMFHVFMGLHNSFKELPQVDNTAVCRLVYNTDHWRLVCWNDTSHLAGCELMGTRY